MTDESISKQTGSFGAGFGRDADWWGQSSGRARESATCRTTEAEVKRICNIMDEARSTSVSSDVQDAAAVRRGVRAAAVPSDL